MEPYFLKIDDNLISTGCKNKVINFALENQDKFKAYKMKSGQYDGNNFVKLEPHIDSELKNLITQCSLDFYYMLLMHKPYQEVVKHRDGPFGRNCVLIIPLLPVVDYPPTNFYDIHGTFATKCIFSDLKPAFVNTQQTHGLTNKANMRLNLQLCFDTAFEKVVELYKDKKLFNPI